MPDIWLLRGSPEEARGVESALASTVCQAGLSRLAAVSHVFGGCLHAYLSGEGRSLAVAHKQATVFAECVHMAGWVKSKCCLHLFQGHRRLLSLWKHRIIKPSV